jgi:polysaccharide export outer membrane protein
MMRFSTIALVASLAVATLGATAPKQEIIHPGDQLNIQVFGQQTLSQNVTVLPDGSVTYPLIGRIQLGGQSVDMASSLISAKLAKYVRHPYVTVAITQLGQPSVLVLGNVKTPGKYQLRSDARVTDAIAAAGGIANLNGEMPDARISDAQGAVTTVSLQKLLHDGNTTLDQSLGEGSVVYVPGPTLIDVVVTGAVDHPGDIQVAEGDKLSMAIAKAGNSANANADLNNIRVMRTGPDGKPQETTVNLYQALEKGDGSADLALQKGDTIYVPQAKKKSGLFDSGGLLYLLSRLIP